MRGLTLSTHTVAPFQRTTNAEALSAAASKRHDPRVYARSIVKKWSAMTADQRAEVSAILSPVLGRVEAGR